MKRNIILVFLALTFLFAGMLAVFCQTAAAADRGNAAPRGALPEELKDLDVNDDFIHSGAQHAGVIRTVIGHVVVLHEDTGEAYFAAAGDAVFKHDSIFTLDGSRCRIKFTTEDVITMGENARLGLEEYIDNRKKRQKKSVFSMLRGKAMFYAVRLFKYRKSSTSVRTPTAVVGVRGTKFGVDVQKTGEKIAARQPVYLADASGSGPQNLLSQGGLGGQFVITHIHCFAGLLSAALAGPTGAVPVLVHAGESFVTTAPEVSRVVPTLPGVREKFESVTEVPEPGETGAKKEGAAVTVGKVADTGGDTGTAQTDVADKAQDATELIIKVDLDDPDSDFFTPEPILPPIGPQVHKGYFTNLLTDQNCCGSPILDNVYVSSSRQDFDVGPVRAEGLFNLGPPLPFVDGTPGSDIELQFLKQVSVDGTPALTSADNLNLPVTENDIGGNQYQVWGNWSVAQTFDINGFVHDLINTGYFIFGEPTPDPAVAGISGTYSGPAFGTYWDALGGNPQGIDMTGTFSCNVSSSAISDFNLSVAGGGKTASITGATGTFNSSSFAIDTGTGTWDLNGASPPNYRSAHGSLYGPNGEHIGGAWGMKEDSLNGAAGIFQGDKQ